jgi:signal transduction histidine kinase/CheY-like chemotaxis protein
MVESMSEGAATLIGDGIVAYANTRLASMLRAPLERLLGGSLVEYLDPADAERFKRICAAAREGFQFEEMELRCSDGTTLPARIALNPLPSSSQSNGSSPPLCLVVTDLTDSRRNAELAAAIKERLSAEAALREASRHKDVFLAMLAHELRNPLSPIRNASAILMRLVGSAPQAQALIAMITRQTDHLARLVDDLLDVSRIAQNRIELRKETIEIGEIIDYAVETVQPIMREKSHRLRVDHPGEALHVFGDRARLAQSLSNLLHNAAKYTDSGGSITLVIRATEAHIDFEIHDDGNGISRELLPHVFELFVQADRTLDRAQGGLGIGLSLVKGLIEMHGGTITAASDGPQRGSTFTVQLPRAAPPEVVDGAGELLSVPMRRVLIVDDNVDAADSLAQLLKGNGHEVETAYSATAALECLASRSPEFVLLDIGLPELDGYQLAGRVRALPHLNETRLIAVTGYGQAEDRQRARAAGFDDHLVKPVDLPALDRILAGASAASQ